MCLAAHESLLDFGARFYDPATAIFLQQDPLAEKYYNLSPYAYCANNPVNFVDPDGRFIGFISDVVSVGMGVRSFAKNISAGNIRGAVWDGVGVVVDLAAAAIPVVPGGVGYVRAGINAADNAIDAAKAVNAVDNAADAAKVVDNTAGATKVVHGNSRQSTKAQHAYDIIDTETNKVVKTGVSSGPIRKDGKSYRAEKQVREWNKNENTSKHKSEITHREPEGPGARDKIYDYKKNRANILKEKGELDINKHSRP